MSQFPFLTIYGDTVKNMRMVAEGNFSQVYYAQSKCGKIAAIKKVKKSVKDKTSYELAKKQAEILNGLEFSYVSQLIGTHEEHNYFYLIEKFQQGQSLEVILKKKRKLAIVYCEKIFKGILRGLEYLHSKNIMHRDIKPSNIICDDKFKVVIIDFGFACKISLDDSLSLSERFGTPFYMSPELLSRKKYNSKSDIWSLGVMYYEMLCGSLPFFGATDIELYKDICVNSSNLFKNDMIIPDSIKRMVKKCLTIDIEKRVSWDELFDFSRTQNESLSRIVRKRDIVYEDQSIFADCCSFY